MTAGEVARRVMGDDMKKQKGIIAAIWLYTAGAIAMLGALAAVIVAWNHYTDGLDKKGYDRGVNVQKAADQLQFDRIEAERTKQKAEANALYRTAQADIIALQEGRASLIHYLEVQDASHRKTTADLSAKYAGVELRFKASQGSAQGAGCGANGSGAVPTEANPSGDAPATYIQLPAKITSDLRQLSRDAAETNDDYSTCYEYATKVK